MNLVACTRVKNGGKYVKRWLSDMLKVCNNICVVDNGSTDGTREILAATARDHANIFLRYEKMQSFDEGRSCNILHDMAVLIDADWVLALDIDEFIDPESMSEISQLIDIPKECDDIQAWTFPFFNFWNDEKHYRFDGAYADRHVIRLYKFNKDVRPAKKWLHVQMCPDELDRRLIRKAPCRIVHYGYMDEQDRQDKYNLYTSIDKDAVVSGGGSDNYKHIIEPNPVLKEHLPLAEWVAS